VRSRSRSHGRRRPQSANVRCGARGWPTASEMSSDGGDIIHLPPAPKHAEAARKKKEKEKEKEEMGNVRMVYTLRVLDLRSSVLK